MAPRGTGVIDQRPDQHRPEASAGEAGAAEPAARVRRALMALRRGEVVTVEQADGRAWQILALDAALSPDQLPRLERAAGAPAVVVVSRRRAAALGFDRSASGAAGGEVVLVAEPDPRDDGCAGTGWTLDRLAAVIAIGAPRDEPGGGFRPASEPPAPAQAAAVALAKLARLLPAVAAVPLAAAGAPGVGEAERVAVAAIARYEIQAARDIRRVTETMVPLAGFGLARLVAFRPADGGPEHLAIVLGDPPPDRPLLARIHSECFTGDVLGSLRCDCGQQLRGALAEIARVGAGVVLYLAQEGRGIGLVNKLRAYRLQDGGLDTIEANQALGFEADERNFLPAAEMLHQLGYRQVRLMTNNPLKVRQLVAAGIEVVERVTHAFPPNEHNQAYLRTKAERSGHLF